MAITLEGEALVQAWLGAKAARKDASAKLDAAEIAVDEARDALAVWLMPADAQPGEVFAVWYGADLVQVTVGALPGSHDVKLRTRSKAAAGA